MGKWSREDAKAAIRRWRERNPNYDREHSRKRRLEHPEKEAARYRRWQENNRGKANAKTVRHRAAKGLATPKWLTEAQHAEIEAFYSKAAELKKSGIPMEVDHIVPLQGKNVCGLHVPWNLRVIPRRENRSKGNRT